MKGSSLKHYHNREQLRLSTDNNLDKKAKNDVHFIIVNKNERYILKFIEMNYKCEGISSLKQGIKIWPNRCKLKINGKEIKTDRIIIWHTDGNKMKEANNHTYIDAKDSVELEIIDTIEENPNIGIFNVWTKDVQKCYEFCDNSWIKTEIKGINTWGIAGHHEWEKKDINTIELVVHKTV